MIKTQKALAKLVEHATKTGHIAIDTEFVWERTYYPTLGTVQVAFSAEEAFIIDVLEFEDMTALGEILSNADIIKILHDAQQDLTILRRATGAYPQNVFDIRLAAGFCALSSSLSLNALLKEVLDIKLPKTETRSNWLKRPLTSQQITYAKDDVYHLPAMRKALIAQAEKQGHNEWLVEELQKYDDPSLYEENNLQQQFRKIKGFSKLTGRRRAGLRELAIWREEVARTKNYPKNWIIPDQALMNIVQQKPQSIYDLATIEGLTQKTIRRYGITIVQTLTKGFASAEGERQKLPEYTGNPESLKPRADLALAYMKGKSILEGIDPAMVATRAEVTALVRESPDVSPDDHRLLRGWRRDFVGEELLQLTAGKLAIRMDAETGLPMRVLD